MEGIEPVRMFNERSREVSLLIWPRDLGMAYGAGEPAIELKGLEVGEIGNGARDWPGEIAVYIE